MTTVSQPKAPRLVAHLTNNVASVYCPGCERDHRFYAGPALPPDGSGGDVSYNGRHTAGPTFSAILSSYAHPQLPDAPFTTFNVTFCAFAIVGGEITFAADCDHRFAGKTMALPPFPKDFWPGGKVPDLAIDRQKLP